MLKENDGFCHKYGGPVDIAEVYSPPRVTAEAAKYSVKPGEAFDLTCGWDFNKGKDGIAAEAYVIEHSLVQYVPLKFTEQVSLWLHAE